MEITHEEVLSLLRKWRDEKRIIQGLLAFSEKTSCCVYGRIEHLDNDWVRVDDRSMSSFEARTGISIDLMSATGFSFEDDRIAAGTEEADQIRQCYEGLLFVRLPGGLNAQLRAARTGAEIDFSEQ